MNKIIISRTDSIGDVMLTLPICSWLKETFAGVEIVFIGRAYTKPVIDCYVDVDEFLDVDSLLETTPSAQIDILKNLHADAIVHAFPNKEIAKLAKRARIAMRVGTSHRFFHWFTCNHRVNFTRKRSNLHESQLNFKLLRPFGQAPSPNLEEVEKYTGKFQPKQVELPEELMEFISKAEKFVLLHPRSQGSAVEWPIQKYVQLSKQLVSEGYYVVFTGNKKEGMGIRGYIPTRPQIFDSCGKLSLSQLIMLILKADGMIACSTGPLHIAGFLQRKAIGVYSPKRPIHPGRWKPLGGNSVAIVHDEECPICRAGKDCKCIEEISPGKIFAQLAK